MKRVGNKLYNIVKKLWKLVIDLDFCSLWFRKAKNLIGKICQHGTEAKPLFADNFVLGQRKTAKAYGKSDQTKFNLSTDKVAEGQILFFR